MLLLEILSTNQVFLNTYSANPKAIRIIPNSKYIRYMYFSDWIAG